jgi:poly-beta-1,6-N-acetyl-D-glucosamine synthase
MSTAQSQTTGITTALPIRTGEFVVMTAAYNEEQNIEKTIESMLAQTLRPKRWVIASDGSTDGTDAIAERYATEHGFIRFLRISRPPGRSFGSKVAALHQAYKFFDDLSYDFIGNLDADVTVDSNYYEDLITHFERSQQLGIAGGLVFEESNGVFEGRRANRIYSVAHAGQIIRRTCFDAIGGYAVLEYGGEDWHAQISARMKGWTAESVPELRIYHHRHTGKAGSILRHKFRQGRMDYALGSDAIFEVLKCIERFAESPWIAGGACRLAGFSWSWIRRDKRPVSDEFVAYLRSDQRQKICSILSRSNQHAIAKGSVELR